MIGRAPLGLITGWAGSVYARVAVRGDGMNSNSSYVAYHDRRRGIMTVTRGTLLYEGKAKKLFATDQPGRVIQYFKDDATAFNAQKRGTIVDKGVVNNKISEKLFKLLEAGGVPTHFLERLSDREMLTRRVQIVPIEVVVRNIVAGSLAKRL